MNKELEALESIKNHCKHYYGANLSGLGAYKIVEEALKRNEPIKTIFTRVTDDLTERFWDEPACPKCKSRVNYDDKFCHECGQALEEIGKGEHHE